MKAHLYLLHYVTQIQSNSIFQHTLLTRKDCVIVMIVGQLSWLLKAKTDKKGLAALFAKPTIGSADVDLSIGKKMAPAFWDAEKKEHGGRQCSRGYQLQNSGSRQQLNRIFENLCREHVTLLPQLFVARIFASLILASSLNTTRPIV